MILSHFTNVRVPSVEVLTVSAEVSNTSLKIMSGSSVVEKISNCLLSYIGGFLGIYIENLERRALKFCETSAAESALLYTETCEMFPE